MRFHRRCGDRVTLLHDNFTAIRNFIEFNHGLVLSDQPLKDDVMFEISIDRKVNVWNGSLEIGVTTQNPEHMDLPATATKLRNTAWILSGSSVVRDGVTHLPAYGPELDTLQEGDCVGVMRTSRAELLFFINGRCLGVASMEMPQCLYAVVDLYGQCVQVTIVPQIPNSPIPDTACSVQSPSEVVEIDGPMSFVPLFHNDPPDEAFPKDGQEDYVTNSTEATWVFQNQSYLRFHPRCGALVILSNFNQTAERAHPVEDYNDAVVMTCRPLLDGEIFEVRIERLVRKWSGSIELGVTNHNPETIQFPSTMTNMESGTVMLSGSKVLINGQGTYTEYGSLNLDELKVGDIVGVMKEANGNLHYYINNEDQGVAASNIEGPVWGVVDLYGMTAKVSIVDAFEGSPPNNSLLPSVSVLAGLNELFIADDDADEVAGAVAGAVADALAGAVAGAAAGPDPDTDLNEIEDDSHLFHTLHHSNVIIVNNGKTAYRPNPLEYNCEGLVMTRRPLKPNELFQVRIDVIMTENYGTLEMGVTQHIANDLHFPYKLRSAKTGTWALVNEDVIHNGNIVNPHYSRSLNLLEVGDTIGLMRTSFGVLHFYINGVDHGPGAYNVPDTVFGILEIFGRIIQVTIQDVCIDPPAYSPESPISTESTITSFPEMCFHRVQGRNALLTRSRLVGARAFVYSEFNDAILFSSRPLRECDMFEIRVDALVDCWVGNLEIGVTSLQPEDLDFHEVGVFGGTGVLSGPTSDTPAVTATELSGGTCVLSGAGIWKEGDCMSRGYRLDLDKLTVGNRVGMMLQADRSLHYYLDGMDMGKAFHVPYLNTYAVVDLYGQCTQVTILQNGGRTFNGNAGPADNSLLSITQPPPLPPPPYGTFSEYCGKNALVTKKFCVAERRSFDPEDALVFSSSHLELEEIFEIKITNLYPGLAGGLRVGVTDVNILNAHVNRSLPPAISELPHFTAYIEGNLLHYTQAGGKREAKLVLPSLRKLVPGDRIGLKLKPNSRVVVYYNYQPLDVAFTGVPDKVYAVFELYGEVFKIQAMNKLTEKPLPPHVLRERLRKLNIEVSQEIPSLKPGGDMDGSSETIQSEGIEGTPAPSPVPAPVHRSPRPYTFHSVHGSNIKLCSSDTVAVRTASFNGGLAVVSQPIRRGQSFMFRVDKADACWKGSVGVGALGYLPDELPDFAGEVDPPAWLLVTDFCVDNGVYYRPAAARALEEVRERSVLSVEFMNDGRLSVAADSRPLCVIGLVPSDIDQVYPVVDVYGKVQQVSILLHPYVLGSGASLDLPIVTGTREDSSGVPELPEDDISFTDYEDGSPTAKPKLRAHSHSGLVEELATIASRPQTRVATPATMHHSLMLLAPSRDRMHKSHSSHSLGDARRHGYGEDLFADRQACDTNIRHNDRYPEAGEVDNLDVEIVDALTLETGNLPDLTEEHSSSIDESTRRDDLYTDTFASENLHYLSALLGLDRGIDTQDNIESERTPGEGQCAHLAAVLKFWKFLLLPHPELRRGFAWGRAECHCDACHPNSRSPIAGWVRIERADAAGGAARAYWPVSRAALAAARSCVGHARRPSRPAALTTSLTRVPASIYDIWFDEAGKTYHAALALEIDVEGKTPESDCLLAFIIYLKPREALAANSPSSLEE